MKILVIRGENLASLAEPFEIVLEHGMLASAGLYAITGQTGAGKSTILDAMCLALFNQTPRFSGRGGALIGRADEEEGERLRDTDVRSILRRGAANGYAEVEFSGADGERYRSRWSVRRARNSKSGRVQKQEMTFVRVRDGKVLSSNRISETLPQISDALGLQFEQFRRSAMLAQGDFAAFLQADDKARAELLERMTGTEIYREISKACYTQYREVQLELQAAQGQALAIEILSDEDRAKLLEKRTELRQKCVFAATALEQAQRIQRAVDDRARFEQMLRDAKSTCEEKTQIVAAAQPRRDALSARRVLAPHWELRRQVLRYREKIVERIDTKNKGDLELSSLQARKLESEKKREELERRLAAASRSRKEAQPGLERARQLDQQIQTQRDALQSLTREHADRHQRVETLRTQSRELTTTIDSLSSECANLLVQLDASPGGRELAMRNDDVLREFDRLETTRIALVDTTQSLASAKIDEAKLQSRVDELSQTQKTRRRELSQLEEKRELIEKRLAHTNREQLQAQRDRLLEVYSAQRSAARELEPWLRDLHAKEMLVREIEQLRTHSEKCAADLRQLTLARGDAESRRNEAQLAWDRILLTLSLESHRQTLSPGDPCPLCGALEHPYVEQGLATTLQHDAERRVLELREAEGKIRDQVEQAQRVQAKVEAKLAASIPRLDEVTTRIQTSAEAVETWRGEIESALIKLETQVLGTAEATPVSNIIQCIQDMWVQAIVSDVDADTKMDGLQRVIDRAPGLLEQIETLGRGWKSTLDALQRDEKEREELRSQCDARRRELEATQAELERAQSRYGEIQQNVQRFDERKLAGTQLFLEQRTQLNVQLAPVIGLREDDVQTSVEAWREQFLTWQKAYGVAMERQLELEQKIDSAKKEARDRQAALRELEPQAERAQREIENVQVHLARLNDERSMLFEGRSVSDVQREFEQHEEELARQKQDCEREQVQVSEQYFARLQNQRGLQAEIESMQKQCADLELQWNEVLTQHAISPERAQELFQKTPEAWHDEEVALQELDSQQIAAKELVRARQGDLANHRETWPELPSSELANAAFESAKIALDELGSEESRLLVLIERDDQDRIRKKESQAGLEKLIAKKDRWAKMHELIGQADGQKFQRFAQSLTLDQLVALANDHLQELERRYRLQRVPGEGLDLQVIDTYMADEVRSVNSLSGGESFLVSLALALGLSSLSASHTRVESLFIDEGFGTLDRESLERAISALEALQATGRQVGIISHVEGLAEQLGAQVQVRSIGGGKSRVLVQARRPAMVEHVAM